MSMKKWHYILLFSQGPFWLIPEWRAHLLQCSPSSVCQESPLLGFVIEESQNPRRDNASGHHFHTAQALSILSLKCLCNASICHRARSRPALKNTGKNSSQVSTRVIFQLASMSSLIFSCPILLTEGFSILVMVLFLTSAAMYASDNHPSQKPPLCLGSLLKLSYLHPPVGYHKGNTFANFPCNFPLSLLQEGKSHSLALQQNLEVLQ